MYCVVIECFGVAAVRKVVCGITTTKRLEFGETEDELLDECGMDALCFVRIAQMGFKLA